MEMLYIVQLEDGLIDYITNLLETHELEFTQEEIQNALDSKLCDLGDVFNVKQMLINYEMSKVLESLTLEELNEEYNIFDRDMITYEMENAQDIELKEEIQEMLDSGAKWFVSWGMGVEILTLENARGLLEND